MKRLTLLAAILVLLPAVHLTAQEPDSPHPADSTAVGRKGKQRYTIADTFNWRRVAASRGQSTNVTLGVNPANLVTVGDVTVSASLPLGRHFAGQLELGAGVKPLHGGGGCLFPLRGELAARWWPWYINSEMYFQMGLQVSDLLRVGDLYTTKSIQHDYGVTFQAGYLLNISQDWAIELGAGGCVGVTSSSTETWSRMLFGGESGKQYYLGWNKLVIGLVYVF